MLKKLIYKIIYKERATPKSYCQFLKKNCLYFGNNVFINNSHKIYIDRDALNFIKIGNNVQFTSDVTVLAHDESYSILGKVYGDYPRKQAITSIGDNVFIGMKTIILMGSSIGDNVIIGAGSVVTGILDSNAVYAGNPIRKICSLDEYYDKMLNNFENSAFLFIDTFYKKHKRLPNIDEIHVYKLLFVDELDTDVNKPKEIVDFVIQNNKKRMKYNSVKEFYELKRK